MDDIRFNQALVRLHETIQEHEPHSPEEAAVLRAWKANLTTDNLAYLTGVISYIFRHLYAISHEPIKITDLNSKPKLIYQSCLGRYSTKPEPMRFRELKRFTYKVVANHEILVKISLACNIPIDWSAVAWRTIVDCFEQFSPFLETDFHIFTRVKSPSIFLLPKQPIV
jgi:hypothetical protein